jgi:hypothetical protein
VREELWAGELELVSEKIARSFVSQSSVGCARAAPLGDLVTAILVKGFSYFRSRVGTSQSSVVGVGGTGSACRASIASTTTIQRSVAVRVPCS